MVKKKKKKAANKVASTGTTADGQQTSTVEATAVLTAVVTLVVVIVLVLVVVVVVVVLLLLLPTASDGHNSTNLFWCSSCHQLLPKLTVFACPHLPCLPLPCPSSSSLLLCPLTWWLTTTTAPSPPPVPSISIAALFCSTALSNHCWLPSHPYLLPLSYISTCLFCLLLTLHYFVSFLFSSSSTTAELSFTLFLFLAQLYFCFFHSPFFSRLMICSSDIRFFHYFCHVSFSIDYFSLSLRWHFQHFQCKYILAFISSVCLLNLKVCLFTFTPKKIAV